MVQTIIECSAKCCGVRSVVLCEVWWSAKCSGIYKCSRVESVVECEVWSSAKCGGVIRVVECLRW